MSKLTQAQADQQTAAERRALRADYRAVLGEVVEGKEQLANAKSADLLGVLGRVGDLHERAQRPKEYAVDAEVFAQLAACGLDMVRRGVAASKNRMPGDFAAQLRATYGDGGTGGRGRRSGAAASTGGGQQIDWASLGLVAVNHGVFATAPALSTMHGPLGEAPKPPSDKKAAAAAAARARGGKKKRQTAEEMEAAAGPKVVPREVMDGLGAANPDGDDKQETDRQMDAMWEALMERADPDAEDEGEGEDEDEGSGGNRRFVDVASLVINHESFAQTVENMFTLSFLVRDQRVRIEHDPKVGLVVRPFSLEQQRAITEGSAAESAAAAAVAEAAAAAAGAGRGVGGRATRGGGGGGGGAAQQQQQQQQQQQPQQGRQQQQRMGQQFIVRFTHEDWEIMRALVPRDQAVTPHRRLGEGLEREERRARADAAAAQQQARGENAAREAARRELDARDEERRAAQRARRQSERERMEKELRAFDGAGGEDEGDENVEAGGGCGGNGGGKKRARGGDTLVDLVDDDVEDAVDNRAGKAMRA